MQLHKVIACFCVFFSFAIVHAHPTETRPKQGAGGGRETHRNGKGNGGGSQGKESAVGIEGVRMGKVELEFSLDEDGAPRYSVSYGGRPVVLSSRLGFVLKDDSGWNRG